MEYLSWPIRKFPQTGRRGHIATDRNSGDDDAKEAGSSGRIG